MRPRRRRILPVFAFLVVLLSNLSEQVEASLRWSRSTHMLVGASYAEVFSTKQNVLVPTSFRVLNQHSLAPSTTLANHALSIRGGASASTESGLVSILTRIGNDISSSKSKCWTILLMTILTETVASSLSKHARDTGSFNLFLVACVLNLVCVGGFTISLAQIEVGVAYACWAALGTAVVSAAGILLFGESCDSIKLVCLLLIMTGVVGLNLRDGQ